MTANEAILTPGAGRNISLKQMRAFVAVAHTGSFTRAAAQLFITQSALSSLIRNLEAELGLRLFDRTTRRLELTDTGRELSMALEQLLRDLDRITLDVRNVKEIRRGRVRIGATPLLAASFFPAAMRSFQVRYPEVTVHVLDEPAPQLLEALNAGDLDMLLATLDREHPELHAQSLLSDTMVLVCHRDHQHAGQERVTWREALSKPLILMRKGSGLRAIVDQTYAGFGEKAQPVQEVNQVSTAIAMVAAGLGVSILPAYAVPSDETKAVSAVPLVEPTVTRHVSLVTLKQRTPSAAAAAMQRHLLEYVRAMRSA